MTRVFAWLCAVMVLAAMGVNGALMLISPPLWLRLPQWLHGNARFTAGAASTFGRSLTIRLLGGVCLAFVLIIVGDLLLPAR